MAEENLGSGLFLDQSLDFDPSSTGDLRTVSGSEELEKDLSFQLIIILSDSIGQPITPATRSEIRSLAVDTITSDSRVDSIDRGSIELTKPDRETIRLQAVVTAGGETRELVFNL